MGPKRNEGTAGRDRAFFLSMAFAAGMIVFLGFAPSYYLRSITHATHYPTGIPISTTLRPLIHMHALVFSAWMLLFIAQNTLVATGRTNVHRRLGIMGAVLLPVMMVLGILTAVRGAKDGWNPGGPYPDSHAFMVVGFGDIFVFFCFAAAGMILSTAPRNTQEAHASGNGGRAHVAGYHPDAVCRRTAGFDVRIAVGTGARTCCL